MAMIMPKFPTRLLPVLLLAAALPGAASAQGTTATAQCAAFWSAWVEVSQSTPHLPKDPADAVLAAAFIAAARAEGGPAVDRTHGRDRAFMLRMINGAMRGERRHVELMETVSRSCEDAARARGLI